MQQTVDVDAKTTHQIVDAAAGCLPVSGSLFFSSAVADAAADLAADAAMTAAETTAVSGSSYFFCAAAAVSETVDVATMAVATAVDVAANL